MYKRPLAVQANEKGLNAPIDAILASFNACIHSLFRRRDVGCLDHASLYEPLELDTLGAVELNLTCRNKMFI